MSLTGRLVKISLALLLVVATARAQDFVIVGSAPVNNGNPIQLGTQQFWFNGVPHPIYVNASSQFWSNGPQQGPLSSTNFGARSQINISETDTQAGQPSGMFINNIKTSEGWGDSSGAQLAPSDIDQNGDALASYVTAGNHPALAWEQPQPAERAGNWVVTADGYGELFLNNFGGPQNFNTLSCTGTSASTGHCNNTACTGYQGYIAGNILTITAASTGSGCGLVVGQPMGVSSAINAGSYTSSTGAVSTTLSSSVGVGSGVSVNITSISGTGAVQMLNADNLTTTAGTSGTTVNYTAPTGLCGTSATALSCTGGVFSFASGEVESTVVNKWGVPTTIIGCNGCGGSYGQSATCGGSACTGAGGTGTYLLNFSQTIGSSGTPVNLVPGIRFLIQPTGFNASVGQNKFALFVFASTAGAHVRWESELNTNDEEAYDAQTLTPLGQVTTADWRTFMGHLRPAVFRDLGFTGNVVNNVSTWSTRRPANYATWFGYENRPNLYAGTASYTFTGNAHCGAGFNCYTVDWYANSGAPTDKETILVTLPAQSLQGQTSLYNLSFSSSIPCINGVYANVAVSGGSGTGGSAVVVCAENNVRTISFFPGGGGINYAVGDTVSMTAGGASITATVQNLANTGVVYAAKFSANNGLSYQPIAGPGITPLFDNTSQIVSGAILSLTYDADLGIWIAGPWKLGIGNNNEDLANGGAPEVFVQICAEAGTSPWFTEPVLATDSQTDYPASEASYVSTNYPWMHPWFETPDEGWNGQQTPFKYEAGKGLWWATLDGTNWYPPVPVFTSAMINEEGKIASTLGQAVGTVYSASGADVVQGVQTTAVPSTFTPTLRSTSYINQSFAAQSPYTKTPAYNYVTRVAVTNYWNIAISVALSLADTQASAVYGPGGVANLGSISETPLAYQWYTGNSTTRATVAATYGAYGNAYIANYGPIFSGWNTWATSCAGAGAGPSCAVKGIVGYEGGNDGGNNGPSGAGQSADTAQAVNGAVRSSSCQLTLGPLFVGNGATTFTGSISGTTFTPSGNTGASNGGGPQQAFSPGMLLTWNSGANSATITGYVPDANLANMQLSSSATVTNDPTMQIFGNGGYPGMPIALSSISETGGTSWATLAAAGNLTVGSGTNDPQHLSIYQNGTPINCSGYDTLNSAIVTFTGSAQWVNTARAGIWLSSPIGAADTDMFTMLTSNGGVNPSQLNEVAFGWPPYWKVTGFDIYGWFQIGDCTSCSVSGTTLTFGSGVTGEFYPGLYLLGQGVASKQTVANNTTIVSCSTTLSSGSCRTNNGDTMTLSQSAQSTQSGVEITGFSLSPTAAYKALNAWNSGPLQ